jgi:hypothetical protein
MESLALLAAVIVLGIIVLGLLATVTVFRSPRTAVGRVFILALNTMGIASGIWLAVLDIGTGARVIGLIVASASGISAFRTLKTGH